MTSGRGAASSAKFAGAVGTVYWGISEYNRIQRDRAVGVSTDAAVVASLGRVGNTLVFSAVGGAAGAAFLGGEGSVVPGLGTVTGGAIGGALGSFTGAFVADYYGYSDSAGAAAQEAYLRLRGCS